MNNLVLVEGQAFIISDPAGDVVDESSQGLFFVDTRFLSKYILTVNGRAPEPLTSRAVNNYAGSVYAANRPDKAFAARDISIIRDRFVGNGLHEDIILENHRGTSCAVEVRLEFDADFCDLFAVKQGRAAGVETSVEREGDFALVFRHAHETISRGTLISFSEAAIVEGKSAVFKVDLGPKERWKTCVNIHLEAGDKDLAPTFSCGDFDRGIPEPAEKKQWAANLPKLMTDDDGLRHLYERSIADLSALRIEIDGRRLPAAVVPWFMTLFGRDSIITALQTLPVAPDLAVGALETLAQYQGTKVDDWRDEQPGKILHEIRFGEQALLEQTPHARYYGTVDATPLYLILLGEVWRWTADLELVERLLPAAEAALAWIDGYGDIDGDGFVEYQRRSSAGLENQGWKDSHDAVVFADGRHADGPIALIEVQGYVYQAKLAAARLLRAVGRDMEAGGLEAQAKALKDRFNEAFWLPGENYFALALDGKKKRVDSITSNPGHCLWSGIVEPDKAVAVAARLLADDLFSGWGIRTMSDRMAGYSPLSYHNGSVWPHDNSIIAAGLMKYGFFRQAHQVIAAVLDAAAAQPEYRLPELYAGYRRRPFGFPVAYPTASAPQAWASGSVFMFLQALLGLAPDPATPELRATPRLPESIKGVEIEVKAFGSAHKISV